MATHQGGKGIWGERGEIVRCGEKWGDMGRSGEVGGRKEGGALDVAALSRPSPSRQTQKQHCICFVDKHFEDDDDSDGDDNDNDKQNN